MVRTPSDRRPSIDPRRIVVVGPCASGKTALTRALTEAGYDARVCGQEHSCVRDLWRRMQGDVLIALDLDIATLRARRDESWPAELLERQHERLAGAYAAADLVLDSGRIDQRSVYVAVTRLLAQPQPPRWRP